MKELQSQLETLMKKAGRDVNLEDKDEKTMFPFSKEGRMMAYLLATSTISYEQYLDLNREYIVCK